MKTHYSIEELAYILDEDRVSIASKLVSSGVIPICDGKPADFSQWHHMGSDKDRNGNRRCGISESCRTPHSSRVIVATVDLLQEWNDRICSQEQQESLTQINSTEQPVASDTQQTSTSGDWKEQARTIADELFDVDTKCGCRNSLKGYAVRAD